MRRSIVTLVLVFALGGWSRAAAPDPGPAPAATPALDAARAKVADGDWNGALRDLQVYVPGHPADTDAARFLGDLYFRVPDYRNAERIWKSIIAKLPDDRQTHNRLGSLYAAEDRAADAIAEFDKSLPSRGGFLGLVEAHRRQGDLALFAGTYATRADDAPFDAQAQWFNGNVLRSMRNFGLAQKYFDRAAALSPRNCSVLVDAGNNLIDLARLLEAVHYFRRCLAIDPNGYSANVDLGEAAIEQGDKAAARVDFERALATRSDGSEALVDIGYLEDDRDQWKTAVRDYIRAMNVNPLEAAAYIDLGYDYNEHQLYTLAQETFIKGLSVAPNDGRLHYMLAVSYNLQGKRELARAQYALAIASDEPDVVAAAQAELTQLQPRDFDTH
jgi:tetratricopeptide (TPR) repeat protein